MTPLVREDLQGLRLHASRGRPLLLRSLIGRSCDCSKGTTFLFTLLLLKSASLFKSIGGCCAFVSKAGDSCIILLDASPVGILGIVNAVKWLREADLPFRFIGDDLIRFFTLLGDVSAISVVVFKETGGGVGLL